MAAIASLKAVLGIDNKQFKAGIKDSDSSVKRFSKTVSDAGKLLATAFSVGAIIRATRSVVDFASEIRHSADNMRVSTEVLQSLNAMALRYGVDVNQMTRGLSKMLLAQDGVTKQEKTYTDALKALNIEQAKFIQADPASAMAMIGAAYAKADNQQAAFAAVAELLGERIGPKLVAFMIDLGRDGLQTVIDQAKAAGNVINDDLITSLEALGTKSDQIMLRLKVGWAQALGGIGTAVDAAATWMAGILEGPSQEQLDQVSKLKARAKSGEISLPEYLRELRGIVGAAIANPGGVFNENGDNNPANPSGPVPAGNVSDDDSSQSRIDKLKDERRRVIESAENSIARLRERQAEFSPIGVGQTAGGRASIGGFTGGSRGDLGIKDRQLKISQQQLDTNRQIQDINSRMLGEVAELNSKIMGDPVT